MTRAMRERLRAPRPAEAAFATIKVRFPEGISLQVRRGALYLASVVTAVLLQGRAAPDWVGHAGVPSPAGGTPVPAGLPAPSSPHLRAPVACSWPQGEFAPGEPVAAVFAWVADSLSDPLHTYELVLPSRQPLEARAQSGGWAGGWWSWGAQLVSSIAAHFDLARACRLQHRSACCIAAGGC